MEWIYAWIAGSGGFRASPNHPGILRPTANRGSYAGDPDQVLGCTREIYTFQLENAYDLENSKYERGTSAPLLLETACVCCSTLGCMCNWGSCTLL